MLAIILMTMLISRTKHDGAAQDDHIPNSAVTASNALSFSFGFLVGAAGASSKPASTETFFSALTSSCRCFDSEKSSVTTLDDKRKIGAHLSGQLQLSSFDR